MSGATHLMGPQARALRRALAGAADEHVLRVLRYVDGLADRGAADSLLEPVRDRLRQLRPPRALPFPRVLFTPLDPVLVNAQDWRPVTARMPRSVIGPLSRLVAVACSAESAAADVILADISAPEQHRIEAAGAIIWPAAAAALAGAAMPADWAAAGLLPALFKPLATAASVCLGAAGKLAALADPSATTAEIESALATLLSEAKPRDAAAWGMLVVIMLQLFPAAEAPRKAAFQNAEPVLRGIAADALDVGWHWLEAGVPDTATAPSVEVALRFRRRARLLAELARDPAQHSRATTLQAKLRQTCTARLETDLHTHLIGPLAAPLDTAQLDQLEEDVRDLMRLETEARLLDGGHASEALLQNAAQSVRARSDLTVMERARLIELLLGSAAAQQLLQGAG